MKRIYPFLLMIVLSVACTEPEDEHNSSSNNPMNNTANNTSNNMTDRTGQVDCGKDFMGDVVRCSANQYCADSVLNRCEVGCLSDDNCTSAQTCIKQSSTSQIGACQTKPMKDPCADVTCGADETCNQGQCVKKNTDPCAGVSCGADEVCNQGQCVKKNTDPCAGVSCGTNEVCRAGKCEAVQTSCQVTFSAQDGCASDSFCIYNDQDKTSCFAFPTCDASNNCAPGLEGSICSTRLVQGKDPQCLYGACLEDTDCPNAHFCVKSASDIVGFCVEGRVGDECYDGTDCIDALSCNVFVTGETGFCEDSF